MNQPAVVARPWARPADQFARWAGAPHPVWLDSAGPRGGAGGCYSFLAANPATVFRARGPQIEIISAAGLERHVGNPFDFLDRELARHRCAADHPFPVGAAIGYCGYGLKRFLEKLPDQARDDLGLPDCWFGFYDHLLVFDHARRQVWEVGADRAAAMLGAGLRPRTSPDRRSPDLAGALETPRPRGRPQCGVGRPADNEVGPTPAGLRSNFTRAQYRQAVRRAKDYIAAGDIYQVNLSQRFQGRIAATPLELYRALRRRNPAPYCAYLDIGDAQVLSSSPECFLRIDGREVVTRPIKGTRPRGRTPAADRRLARELRASAKDNAELVMITDLERNDLGKVCEFGSVQVPELVRAEPYATVWHLVATVAGRLRPEVSAVDCLRACFPGGSITGAPKIRAMEIIDELEPHARGVYTGAIGFLGFNDRAHLNVAIRTIVHQRGRLTFHAGGGIVADSEPDAEYEETLAKARGMIHAIEQLRLGERPIPARNRSHRADH